jgi:putative toxin-antitoxin system antitoxin component (TIGR02293 family)
MPSRRKATAAEAVEHLSVERTVAERLGGKRVLGDLPRSQADILDLVVTGLPVEAIDYAIDHGHVSRDEVAQLVLPPRTLSHRRARQEPLSAEESERLIRVLRTKALAERAFGSPEKAERWLHRGLAVLGGRTPTDVCSTETGARLVEQILAKIEYGAAA